jgi:hypothetical protein
LGSTINTLGDTAANVIADDFENIREMLGGNASLIMRNDRRYISDRCVFEDLDTPEGRVKAYKWLAERTNTFVNVLRPRVRSVVADLSTGN